MGNKTKRFPMTRKVKMKDNNLHNIKNTGFKAPKDYFDTLEDQVLTQVKLESQTKDAGFKIPEDYFDSVETSVLEKLNKPEPKVIKLLRKKTILYASSIAAAVVLLFNLNIFDTANTLDTLDIETVENYLLDEIEVNDLSLLFDDTELSQSDFIDYDSIEIDNYIDDIDLNELYQE